MAVPLKQLKQVHILCLVVLWSLIHVVITNGKLLNFMSVLFINKYIFLCLSHLSQIVELQTILYLHCAVSLTEYECILK